ncbi:hypothetical protein CAEBREN_00929 [Caenorhabditis brenneri]|uniref:Uncharacterized protein n=1 Tax=Caenorhabditis brenneri TaxID=135651 RepID=G0N107_CAEBE|nr:hypothetical protein CAEBREN_00929 [Caenorhabditis brenneri]
MRNFGTAFKLDLMVSESLDMMLDKFEVDKSLITIIPEFEFEYTRNSHLKYGLGPVHYVDRDGCRVVTPGQAMYTVFQNVVCGTNWNLNYCSQHSNCRSDCRNTILNVMQKCLKTEIAMVPLDTVMKSVNEIKALCHLHNKPDLQNLDCFYEDKGPDDSVAIDKYMKAIEMYGLYPPRLLMEHREKNLVLPTFLVRALMMCGWMQSFFKSDCPNLRRVVFDELLSLLPDGTRDSLEPSMREITFTPYSHNEIFQLSSNTIPVTTKLAADRERRNQKLLEKKKQKSKNKEQPSKVVEEKKSFGIPKDKSVFKFVKSWKDHSEDTDLTVEVGLVQVGRDVYASNHAIIKNEPQNTDGMNYFYTSKSDYLKNAKIIISLDCLRNQTVASHFFNIVVRAIKTTTGNYVLCNEVLEVIPLLMEKQKIPLNVYETKLRSYREKWNSGNSEVLNSVGVSFFKAILDDLNVDRSLITIIPDSHHYLSHTKIINREVPFLFTMINWNQRIMCKEQAIFYIFHSVVCGVNWKTKSCKKNKSVVDNFKQKYFEETGKYENMSKGTFVTQKLVEKSITLLLSHEVFKDKIAHRTSDFYFADLPLAVLVPRSDYLKKCDIYALPVFDNIEHLKIVPVALVRTWIYVGWVQNFYPIEMFKSKRIVVTELQYMWNAHERESSLGHFMTLVKSSAIDREEEEQERELAKMRKLMSQTSVLNKVQKISRPSETPQEPTTSSETPPEPQPTELPGTPPPESSNPTPTITKTAKKKIAKQPKPCQKCTENGVALLNAREELRKIEITAKSNEKRAKRTEKAEQDLKNTEMEMEALEKEIDDLRIGLKAFDGQEEVAKASKSKTRKDLENLEWQIELEEDKIVKDRRRNTMLVKKFNDTQEELVIMESERDAGAQGRRPPRTVSSEGPSTYHVPFVPSLPTTDDPELARNPKWVLEQWRQMRTDFENDDEVQNEKEMIENFIAIVEDLGTKQLAEYELCQFEGTSRIYLKHIDLNILKIEKTGDISNLSPLAKYPCLSMEFSIEHDKLMGEN